MNVPRSCVQRDRGEAGRANFDNGKHWEVAGRENFDDGKHWEETGRENFDNGKLLRNGKPRTHNWITACSVRCLSRVPHFIDTHNSLL